MATATLRLYELPEAFRSLDAAITEADGELTPELEAELDELEDRLEARADAIAALIRERTAEAEALRAEGDRFAARARVQQNAAEGYKQYLKRTMEALDRDRVKGERFTVNIRRNSVPSVRCLVPADELPEALRRVKYEADRDAILKSWRAGEELPEGVTAEIGTHLRIS